MVCQVLLNGRSSSPSKHYAKYYRRVGGLNCHEQLRICNGEDGAGEDECVGCADSWNELRSIANKQQ